ncbi:MAG: branched-chain amino acid aminotransferase [Oscillospiraceae bacterium]|jgi:branched-chain amino acid aminotransferase|nr:branched-chain amino acid aminotransferase [Oscillospiraceae bacterium]
MDITITKTTSPKAKPADETGLGFGKIFSDHMFIMEHDKGEGWHDARIVPFGDISLSPAAMVLHYGQEIFEGLKAYRTPDDTIRLFRPEENFKRLNVSARRSVIPEIPVEDSIQALNELIKTDVEWVPRTSGASLYIRPFIFAADPFIGVRPSDKYYYIIFTSPSGAYYSTGLNPVSIYVEENYVRAVKGGMGFIKAGGNYAASLIGQQEAHAKNYEQVLWLDGVERKYIEEVGAMNVFFVIDGCVVTPELSGSILPGITRMSVIELCRKWGLKVAERRLSADEVFAAYDNGKLSEIFGSGTAAVISPVGVLSRGERAIEINGGKIGEISQRLYDTLTGIQYGRIPDDMGWTRKVEI